MADAARTAAAGEDAGTEAREAQILSDFEALFASMSARLEANLAQVAFCVAVAAGVVVGAARLAALKVPPGIEVVAFSIAVWYLFEWRIVRRGLSKTWLRFVASTLEVSLATVFILLDLGHVGPLYAHTSPAILIYPLAVAAAVLRLDPLLCVYAGALGSLQFFVLFGVIVPHDDPMFAELMSVHLPGTLMKTFYIFGIGIIGMIAAIGVRRLLGRLLRTAIDRERVRGLFGVFVSEQVVDQLLQVERLAEAGERRQVTICCSDIRGFTTLSETKPPEDVVGLLNTYFDAMCGVVARHGGVVNKFMGDGMLIVFGAPNRLDDDAGAAFAAARDMVAEAGRLFASGEFPGLRIGVAIHRGEAVVGTVGGSQRREYTVIGDTVNTAFRIEGLTKMLGRSVLITEEVRAALGEQVALDDLGPHKIRGREGEVRLFAPAESAGTSAA